MEYIHLPASFRTRHLQMFLTKFIASVLTPVSSILSLEVFSILCFVAYAASVSLTTHLETEGGPEFMPRLQFFCWELQRHFFFLNLYNSLTIVPISLLPLPSPLV